MRRSWAAGETRSLTKSREIELRLDRGLALPIWNRGVEDFDLGVAAGLEGDVAEFNPLIFSPLELVFLDLPELVRAQ